jgi:hypothetical protein
MKDKPKRKILIVIEEDGSHEGAGFKLYMEGDKDRIGRIPSEEYSAAEFWGLAIWQLACHAVTKAKAVHSVSVDQSQNAPGSDELQ